MYGKVILNFGGLVMTNGYSVAPAGTSTSTEAVRRVQLPMGNRGQCIANSFFNQSMMGTDDLFMGLGPIGGEAMMNGSCFGGGFGGGYMPGGGMYPGMGYGPGSETMNMTQKEYLQYQEELEKYQINKQVRQQKLVNAARFAVTSEENVITRSIGILNGAVVRNEQDHIPALYGKLLNSVREKLASANGLNAGELTEEQVKSEAERLYEEKTGKSLIESINQNGDSSLWYGIKRGLSFGLLTDSNSSDETIASITGEPVSKSSTAMRWLGTAVGAVVSVGAAIGAAIFGGKAIGKLLTKTP